MEIKRLFLIVFFWLGANAFAELKLNEIFTHNMVIQQGKEARIFGTSDPGSRVKVRLGTKSVTAKTDDEGNWVAVLKNIRASKYPMKLTVESKQKTGMANREYNNIYIGDVWLLAGGTNMNMGYGEYAQISTEVASFENELIRGYGIAGDKAAKPRRAIKGDYNFRHHWQAIKGDYAPVIPPHAYKFAEILQKKLRAPIGLLKAAHGKRGTKAPRIDSWVPAEAFETVGLSKPEIDESKLNNNTPSAFYNTMIAPIKNMAFKGVIWYQGEEDLQNLKDYDKKLRAVITGWRKAMDNEELPFIVVQASSYKTGDWNTAGSPLAWQREMQAKALKDLPNTGLVVTTDLGEYSDKFFYQKKTLGERLALHAFKLKRSSVVAESPTFKKMDIRSYKVTLEFDHVSKLVAKDLIMNKVSGKLLGEDKEAFKLTKDKISGFMIAGADKKFHPASAVKLSGKRIELYSKMVRKPVAVRYGWDNFVQGNVFSDTGLPLKPFRTDEFPMPIFNADLIGGEYKGKEPQGTPLKPVMQVGRNILAVIQSDFGDAYRSKPVDKQTLRFAYFKVDSDAFKNGKQSQLTLSVVYYDSGKGEIAVQYDSKDKNIKVGNEKEGAFKTAGKITLTGSNKWKVVDIKIKDALFNGQCHGADVRLQRNGGDLILKSVIVKAAKAVAKK